MAGSFGLVLLVLCATVSVANAADAYAKSYTSFYAAVTATSDASTCKQIIDTIGLKATMSNPKLALTIFVPSNAAFTTMAARVKLSPTALTTSMTKNAALGRQIMYYHFVTGPSGQKAVLPTWSMKAGMLLDTMYMSATTKKAYQLSVGAVVGTKALIKSVGTSAYTYMPNIQCGAGIAHGIDNVLLPMSMTTVTKYI